LQEFCAEDGLKTIDELGIPGDRAPGATGRITGMTTIRFASTIRHAFDLPRAPARAL
jgi:hypothetical protein